MSLPRETPIEITPEEFRQTGYQVIDAISKFLMTIRSGPVTTGESPDQLKKVLGDRSLPENGTPATEIMPEAVDHMVRHSLFNGHPKFLGYITSSATPIGALADLLAAAINPNVGANILSPMATEIEKQTIEWLAELIGLPSTYGGVLVSGGNMANFTAFLAARNAIASEKFKTHGIAGEKGKLTVFCSKATHIWIEKAATLFGHGTQSIRWIPVDEENKMESEVLEREIRDDRERGNIPFLIVGNAGDVSTGAVDQLQAIGEISKKYGIWFHIDGAYGIPAAILPELRDVFKGIEDADSIAMDPHKWLYSPLEVGCTLVKNPKHLTDTYSSHPEYYHFSNEENQTVNFYEYGLQNSRGFRALKVWLGLRQAGRSGYARMIAEDIRLSRLLFDMAVKHPELEAVTQSLSITTLRFVPPDRSAESDSDQRYLNELNENLLDALQAGGELFLSNAVINDKYCLRACIVNFRTSEKDIREIVDILVREGANVHRRLLKESMD